MPQEPARNGYVFAGWYTQQKGGGTPFIGTTVVTENITVYARWTALYTVTFDADGAHGGTPATQTKTVMSGASIGSAMPQEPTRSGYVFDGWYTQQNGGGSEFAASTAVTGNITVYAQWLPGVFIQIGLPPAEADPPLSNTSLFVNQPAQFSAGSGYGSYAWYWNGKAIIGEVSSTYTLAANTKTPGIYELSVVVTTGAGERLSARCRVTIKAN
jgi:uncharacterized repeat protein (TIGR02543 family)